MQSAVSQNVLQICEPGQTPGQYTSLACRERRKQRFSNMEHVIDDLSAQLKHMSNVSSQNAALQVRPQLDVSASARSVCPATGWVLTHDLQTSLTS